MSGSPGDRQGPVALGAAGPSHVRRARPGYHRSVHHPEDRMEPRRSDVVGAVVLMAVLVGLIVVLYVSAWQGA